MLLKKGSSVGMVRIVALVSRTLNEYFDKLICLKETIEDVMTL